MRLSAPNQHARFTDAQIANAKASGSIVSVAERGGVVWDPRKSRPANGDYWALCPFHQEKTPSFHVVERGGSSFFACLGCGEKGDAIALAQQLFSCSFPEALRIVADGELEREPDPHVIEARERRKREADAEAKRARLLRHASAVAIWDAAEPIGGTIVTRYLRAARRITGYLGKADLRFHPAAPLNPYEPDKGRKLPAMVAAIRSASAEHIGTHVTFLRADGSDKATLAHLPGSRLVCGEHVGGFIRLGPMRSRMVVGEGIESTLSACDALDASGLAAINAANLRAVILPAGVACAIIAHDCDAKGAGQLSAEALAERLWSDGRAPQFASPPDGFNDWNAAAQAGALPRTKVSA